MTKTIETKIAELETLGWEYQPEFRLHIKDNVFVQLQALTKDDLYRPIKDGKIGRAKAI